MRHEGLRAIIKVRLEGINSNILKHVSEALKPECKSQPVGKMKVCLENKTLNITIEVPRFSILRAIITSYLRLILSSIKFLSELKVKD